MFDYTLAKIQRFVHITTHRVVLKNVNAGNLMLYFVSKQTLYLRKTNYFRNFVQKL